MSEPKKRVLIFIDHDIMIRHFVLSYALEGLEREYELTYVFPKNDKRVKTDVDSLGLKSVRLLPINRARTSRLTQLAQIKSLQRAYLNPAFKDVRHSYRMLFDVPTFRRMRLLALPGVFNLFKRRTLRSIPKAVELETLIEEMRPDVLLHPTVLHGLFATDLAIISEKTGIPFVALINSWDNPSTKAQVARNPDWLAVWGEQTRNHAVDFMGMDRRRVAVLGAAQFDAYNRPPKKDRSQVVAELGIDPSHLFILFAGSSKGVNEMEHLLALDAAIENGDLPPARVVFRPHPWRDPSQETRDFFEIPWRHVVMDPSMKDHYIGPKHSGEATVHLTDYADTHVILSACDLLVGNVSTILLEAALHGKPVISFLPADDPAVAESAHLSAVLKLNFFRELVEGMKIPVCRSVASLVKEVRDALVRSRASDFAEGQRNQARFFADQDGRAYAERLTDLLRTAVASD